MNASPIHRALALPKSTSQSGYLGALAMVAGGPFDRLNATFAEYGSFWDIGGRSGWLQDE